MPIDAASLKDIPGGGDAVVIATRPDAAEDTMREVGITRTWMRRSFGEGSVCDEATVYGCEHGITVIDGGCPLVFAPTADVAHQVMRFVFTHRGKVASSL